MSTSRVDPRAGYVNAAKVTACRECATPRPDGARWKTFCSPACVHAWKLRSQPGYAAAEVLKRDAGVCAMCELDCVALLAELSTLLRAQRATTGGYVPQPWQKAHAEWYDFKTGPFADRIRDLGLTRERARLRRRLWEMDHVVPVVEGGGACGLDNLRTLCWRCHARETAELAARRAAARRQEAACD